MPNSTRPPDAVVGVAGAPGAGAAGDEPGAGVVAGGAGADGGVAGAAGDGAAPDGAEPAGGALDGGALDDGVPGDGAPDDGAPGAPAPPPSGASSSRLAGIPSTFASRSRVTSRRWRLSSASAAVGTGSRLRRSSSCSSTVRGRSASFTATW